MSQSAGCSDEFWELSLCSHGILSSHTSLPLLSDPPRQEQNPGNVSYAELQLRDTCSDNQHRAKPSTLGLRLSPCIRPHPDLCYLHIHTPALWAEINKKQTSVFMSQALTLASPDNFLGANPCTSYKHFSLVGCP